MKRSVLLPLAVFCCVSAGACAGVDRSVASPEGETAHAGIVLVLGNKDPAVRETRVALACDLMRRGDLHFDKIILSGGCGAHGTDETNCEATDMERLLEETCGGEIAGLQVVKEEGSGSTAQNYCNSRSLGADGGAVIRGDDTLYVVSSHYHALSVAACFRNDGVDAHYYYTCGDKLYEGVPPSLAEVAASREPCFQDYAGIAGSCGSPGWCDQPPSMR